MKTNETITDYEPSDSEMLTYLEFGAELYELLIKEKENGMQCI